jgi:hypothetical protein
MFLVSDRVEKGLRFLDVPLSPHHDEPLDKGACNAVIDLEVGSPGVFEE